MCSVIPVLKNKCLSQNEDRLKSQHEIIFEIFPIVPAKIWAVVPAGGVGLRMNATIPKQYLPLIGGCVIEHALRRLCDCDLVTQLVIGVARNDTHWPQLGFEHEKLGAVVNAGPERVDTVENCLNHIVQLGGEADWALVHDAARPCVRIADINTLIEKVIGLADGGILAVPLSDTIKRSGQVGLSNTIEQTVPRDDLWRAMTPQLFKVGALLEAIQSSRAGGVLITDEASAMETQGAQTLLIPCSPDNIKITLPQDIQFAKMVLQAQDEEAL